MRLYHHALFGPDLARGLKHGSKGKQCARVCARKSDEWSVRVDGSVGGSEREETEGGDKEASMWV